jgi:hypothetical protein
MGLRFYAVVLPLRHTRAKTQPCQAARRARLNIFAAAQPGCSLSVVYYCIFVHGQVQALSVMRPQIIQR